MYRKLTYSLGIILVLHLAACTNDTPEVSNKDSHEIPEIVGVSVWDRISTRSEPLRSSPRTTLMSLGESFLYLDTFAIDSSESNTKFLKARLSDSTVVWVYDFACVLDAKPAVIVDEVPLYMRPDLLTITADKLGTMEIVAVVEEWDDWIKVVNEKKELRGWIKRESLSYATIDLAFALLCKRTLEEEDPELRVEKLEELLENNPYPNTVFIEALKERLDQERELLWEYRNEQEREDRERENQDRRRRR
jgi:hypothetical protein